MRSVLSIQMIAVNRLLNRKPKRGEIICHVMTSSFKRAQRASPPPLPLRLDSLSSHRRRVTTLCVRLVTSNLSAISIFYPARCALPFRDAAARLVLHLIRRGSHFLGLVGWVREFLGRFSPTHRIRLWIPSTSLINSPVNSCWCSFPYSSAVAWLCQSERRASAHGLTAAGTKPIFFFCKGKILFSLQR